LARGGKFSAHSTQQLVLCNTQHHSEQTAEMAL